ncbi:hypothetical protein [Allorhodopirellula solitaria]|nr:hypothetical protein [Allorhodopirellula solitaria]
MNISHLQRILIVVMAFAFAGPANADTAEQLNAANKLVRDGEFENAIEKYREIDSTGNARSELTYNLGVAQYRQGDLDAAKSLFREVSTWTNGSLAAAARYNLGNCFYSSAITVAKSDGPAAIDSLTQAISHYRAALHADPHHVDARANIELAVELRKQLQQEQEQQEQEQQEQEQEQQEQEQQEQEQEQEEDGDEQSEDGEDSESEGDSSEQSDSSVSQDEPQQPSDSSEDGDSEQSDESSDSQQSDQEQRDQEQTEQENQSAEQAADSDQQPAEDSSQQAEQPPSGEEPSGGDPDQQESQAAPEGELAAENEQEPSDGQPNAGAVVDPSNAGLMTKEEALKMLQAVRDRDMLRRMRHEQLERQRHVPTERDW